MREISSRPQTSSLAANPEKKAKISKMLEDEVEMSKTSLMMPKEKHRKYKIYLAREGKKMNEDFMEHIDKCIKDIE